MTMSYEENGVTTEEAIKIMLADPSRQELLREAFLIGSALDSAKAYAESDEFACTLELIGKSVKGLKVADIGAGRGIGSYAFAMAGAEKIFAVEPDPSDLVGQGAIRQLGMAGQIEIISDWGEKLGLPNDAVDVVYARQVLHHARDLDQLLRECARILKPGGVFVACREHVADNEEQLAAFLRNHPTHQLAGGEHAFRLDQYVGAIEKAGLAQVRVLKPWDSVICAFPKVRTRQDLRDYPKRSLQKRLGVLGGFLGTLPPVKRLFIRKLNSLRVPGRMYSFSARKSA
jgi:ubiquinone/menaquinone biosynthesis C-methylase UbiE